MRFLKLFLIIFCSHFISFAEEYKPSFICKNQDELNEDNKCVHGKEVYEPRLKCKRGDKLNRELKCEDRQAQPTKE